MTTSFKKDRIALPNGIVQRTYLLSQFLVALLLGVGAPTISVIKFAALFVCLIAVGGLLWSIVNQSRHVSSTEFIGVGFVVGLTFAILFDQLFIFWDQRSLLIWCILIVPIAVSSQKIDLKSSSFRRTEKKNLGEIYVLFAFIAIGLAGFANGMQAIALVSLGFAAAASLLLNGRSLAFFWAVNFLNGAACFLVLRSFQSTESYGPKYLRHLFSGSDDLLFSESLSNSFSRFVFARASSSLPLVFCGRNGIDSKPYWSRAFFRYHSRYPHTQCPGDCATRVRSGEGIYPICCW